MISSQFDSVLYCKILFCIATDGWDEITFCNLCLSCLRSMSSAPDPQRQTKRPRTDRSQIPTILPATHRARLAALNLHTSTAEVTASSSSTASSHARTNHTTPGPQKPPAAPHTATPISAPSVDPSRNGNPTTAPQSRPECPQAPPHTPVYAAGGTHGYEARVTAVYLATTTPTMAAQVPPGEPNAAHAASPTLAAVQARSAELVLRPHHDQGSGTCRTSPSPASQPSSAP